MMNMNLQAVVTLQSIYHGCSTRKMLWEEKFTGEEELFSAVNMKNCGHWNVRKHREIKDNDKYVTLDISLKFDIMDKMKITSSESKGNLGIPGKGLITSLGLKAKVRPHRWKKARYAIKNISKKDLSKIIREFEKLFYKSYEKKRPKHGPTDSYFYLAKQLEKCMIRSGALNSHGYPVRTEMTATKHILTSHVGFTDESKLKEFPVNKTLSESCSTDEDESKGIIVEKCSTEDGESESKGIITNKYSTEKDES